MASLLFSCKPCCCPRKCREIRGRERKGEAETLPSEKAAPVPAAKSQAREDLLSEHEQKNLEFTHGEKALAAGYITLGVLDLFLTNCVFPCREEISSQPDLFSQWK